MDTGQTGGDRAGDSGHYLRPVGMGVFKRPEPETPVMTDFVSTDWVADNIDGLAVVDVRDGWEYDAMAHLPGAVSIPFDRFRTGSGDSEGMLPGHGEWASLLGPAG